MLGNTAAWMKNNVHVKKIIIIKTHKSCSCTKLTLWCHKVYKPWIFLFSWYLRSFIIPRCSVEVSNRKWKMKMFGARVRYSATVSCCALMECVFWFGISPLQPSSQFPLFFISLETDKRDTQAIKEPVEGEGRSVAAETCQTGTKLCYIWRVDTRNLFGLLQHRASPRQVMSGLFVLFDYRISFL